MVIGAVVGAIWFFVLAVIVFVFLQNFIRKNQRKRSVQVSAITWDPFVRRGQYSFIRVHMLHSILKEIVKAKYEYMYTPSTY